MVTNDAIETKINLPLCEHEYTKVRADYVIICIGCEAKLSEWKDIDIPETGIGFTEEF